MKRYGYIFMCALVLSSLSGCAGYDKKEAMEETRAMAREARDMAAQASQDAAAARESAERASRDAAISAEAANVASERAGRVFEQSSVK